MYRLVAALALVLGLALPASAEEHLVIELKSGRVVIDLLEDVAPGHVERVIALTKSGAYDGIAFHRVIDGFMAQTGDVQYGKVAADGSVDRQAGFGGSDLPDLQAEFSNIPFERGVVGAARGGHSVNSANSQFFIMFDRNSGLDGSYTVWGRVIEGMEHVDNIKLGARSQNGAVSQPDRMIKVYLEAAPAG